jgi:nucleotide-binding universal stress UspA family protein
VKDARAILCLDGAAADTLLDAASGLVDASLVWVPAHVVDTRGRRELGLLRSGIAGAGPLSASQLQAIDTATAEHTRAILAAAAAGLERRGLLHESPQVRTGEPGRELCTIAAAVQASLVVLFASRRARAASGPGSVGHTARFVLDHAPCPVLLVRSQPQVD